MSKRALICAPLMPEFDRESGSQRIFNTIEYLRSAGWSVSFAADNPHGEERYARALRQLGVAVYRGFDDLTEELFASGKLDVAIFAFWYTAEQHMNRLRGMSPHTRIIVDSIDLHFLRNARRALQRGAGGSVGSLDHEYASETARELNVYAQADAVLTVSRKEADLINDFTGRTDLAMAVADAERLSPSDVPLSERSGVLFVGNFRHPPNVQAAEYLCRDVVPLIDDALLEQHPVSIVGNGLPQSIRELAEGSGGRVRAVGWVPSLMPYLNTARVSVIPLLYGAGTKRKLLQSLMVGTPTVATSIGAEGLDVRHNKHLLIADGAAAMARGVTRLLTDAKVWNRLSVGGAERIRELHGSDVARDQLLMAVESAALRKTAPLSSSVWTAGRYRSLVNDVRDAIHAAVPPRSTVAVVTHGDDELVNLDERIGLHFPRSDDGRYAGHHPADDADALGQLQAAIRQGARYFVVPQTSEWWLDYYRQLTSQLTTSWRRLETGGACAIFELAASTHQHAPATNGHGRR